MTDKKKIELDKSLYECCIKCDELLKDRGQTTFSDGTNDGWRVSICDNRECERYGLLTTVSK